MEQQPEGTWIQKGTQTNVSIDDFNVAFGINLEWHFDRRDTDIPLLDSDGQEYVSSLRLMPYAARAVYPGTTPALNGWQIGFTVAYSGIARALNLE